MKSIFALSNKRHLLKVSLHHQYLKLQKLQIHIDKWHKRRLEIVNQYNKGMSEIEGLILPKHINGAVHAWHLYVVRVVPEMWRISRNELIEKINEFGIGTSVHYMPIHMHSYYIKKYGWEPNFTISYLQSKRDVIDPNPGFRNQLQNY